MTHSPNHHTNHRTDHQYWEYLIPYYVNRTLTPPERIACEGHLAMCPACRQALEDWHRVAGTVQQEVSVWANQTPPLSSEVRAQTGLSGYNPPKTVSSAHAPDPTTLLRGRQQPSRAARRRIQVPLTLVAAAAMIVVFGVLLIYMATSDDESSPASQGETNNILPTLGLRSTDTPLPERSPTSTPLVDPAGSPAYAQPDDLGILGDDSPVATATPLSLQALEPSGVGGAGGAGSTDSAVCQAAPVTNASVAIYDQPGGGAIVAYMTPGEWMDVFQRTVEGWYQLIWPNGYLAGWVRGSEIKLNGSCEDILYPTPTLVIPPGTPTAVFQGSIGMGYLLVTTEQVGTIPANTRVRISHAWMDNGGWWYYIVAEDETRDAEARTWQLTYAPNVTPGPTPTAKFFNGSGYDLMLTEPVGAIPAQSRVTITSGHFNGYEWAYTVIAESGATAEVKESQLVALPSTPIPPGPTSISGATPTATWRYAIGSGSYDMLTTVQVGTIPPNMPVRIESAYYNGSDWVYTIVTEDGRRDDAYTYQITRNMNPPVQATPTNVFQNLVGNGDYRFVTREQTGAIPPYTAVRIDAAWYDGSEWNYTIVSQSGISATARLSQLQYPPPEFFATMTATAQFITPTFTPTPTSLDTQPPPAQIRSFTADPDPAAAGAAITLEWETSNATSVSIREVMQDGTFGQWYEDLDASGTLDVVAPDNDQITYLLVAVDGIGREITGQITVSVE